MPESSESETDATRRWTGRDIQNSIEHYAQIKHNHFQCPLSPFVVNSQDQYSQVELSSFILPHSRSTPNFNSLEDEGPDHPQTRRHSIPKSRNINSLLNLSSVYLSSRQTNLQNLCGCKVSFSGLSSRSDETTPLASGRPANTTPTSPPSPVEDFPSCFPCKLGLASLCSPRRFSDTSAIGIHTASSSSSSSSGGSPLRPHPEQGERKGNNRKKENAKKPEEDEFSACSLPLPALDSVFPFHIILDENLRILRVRVPSY